MLKIHIYQAQDGPRWRAKKAGRIVFESGEAYKKPAGARRSVAALTKLMQPGVVTVVDELPKKI